MNITLIGRSAASCNRADTKSVFAGNLTPLQNRGLKSAQEKEQRRQKADSQISFWENRKQSLKDMECGSVEEIARKLELYHSYEDEIAAAKAAYNNEQMFHALEEAKELGEKIAAYTEKLEPKTEEERKEEIVEEASGTEEKDGMLEEALDEMSEIIEEVQEELLEEEAQQAADMAQEMERSEDREAAMAKMDAAGAEAAQEPQRETQPVSVPEAQADQVTVRRTAPEDDPLLREWLRRYRPMDIRV